MGQVHAPVLPPSTALELDVEALDATVERAIRAGDPRGLRVLGYGALTLVIGWPTSEPAVAVKRLPPFPSADRLAAYTGLLARYVGILRQRGVPVAPTEVRSVAVSPASVRAYLVQPLVPRERHLNVILGHADDDEAAGLLGQIVEIVHRCVDHEVGLDAQAANWWVQEGQLADFDISTPLLRDRGGRDQLDVALFLSVYPAAVQAALGRIAPGVMALYHDRRTVLLDFASNLHKEGLDRWVPTLVRAANERLERPLARADVTRYFRQDKLLWTLSARLRRVDRAWQRHVRRRPYPLLLPPPHRYGPPRRPKEPVP